MARTGAIDATDFISKRAPEVLEELTNTVYDLDVLKKKGYTVKKGKVFAHAGNMVANSLEQAFALLGLEPRMLRPGRIYATDDRRIIKDSDKSVEVDGLYFFTDTFSVEEQV